MPITENGAFILKDNTLSATAEMNNEAVADAAERGETLLVPVEIKSAGTAEEAAPLTLNLQTEEPVKVEIPVSDLKPGTVAVIVKEDGSEELVKTSTIGDNGVVLTLDGSATIKLVDNSKSFDDVDDDDWFQNNVYWAASREIMVGMGDGTVNPLGTATRAQVSAVMERFCEKVAR